MNWEKNRETGTWSLSKVFNGCVYNIFIYPDVSDKTIKYWVGVTSGKKRKEFNIFEQKENKSLGGIKALFWIKNEMMSFPEYYLKRISYNKGKTQYICISWSDTRRRDIYSRLFKEGFTFEMDEGKKILRKKL